MPTRPCSTPCSPPAPAGASRSRARIGARNTGVAGRLTLWEGNRRHARDRRRSRGGGADGRQRRDWAGAEVVVLEARDRIGGRIWTAPLGPGAIDLGAAWVHGRSGTPWPSCSRQPGSRPGTTGPSSRGWRCGRTAGWTPPSATAIDRCRDGRLGPGRGAGRSRGQRSLRRRSRVVPRRSRARRARRRAGEVRASVGRRRHGGGRPPGSHLAGRDRRLRGGRRREPGPHRRVRHARRATGRRARRAARRRRLPCRARRSRGGRSHRRRDVRGRPGGGHGAARRAAGRIDRLRPPARRRPCPGG